MKNPSAKRIFAAMLAFVMIVMLLPVTAIPVLAEQTVYVLDVGQDLDTFVAGTKADGDFVKGGTNDYFTLFCCAKMRIEGNEKSFSDGYTGSRRINYQAGTDIGTVVKNAVMIKTSGPAKVKFWWVSGGDGRQVAIYDEAGNVLCQSTDESKKNLLYISELSISAAGTYYLGNVGGNNPHYKIEVTEESSGAAKPDRGAWSKVEAPVITAATDNGKGEIEVTVSANVGYDGADELTVVMYNSKGKEIATRRSIAEKGEHTLFFEPENSGTYTFKASISRAGQKSKAAAKAKTADFVYPLAAPVILSATSKGDGKVSVVFTPSKEATSYEVFVDGKSAGTTSKTEYTVSGLTIGQKYSFKVVAIRGKDRTESASVSATATKEAKQAWGFIHYGPSTNEANNGYEGSLNEDGRVTVYSEGGKGKIVPASCDGVAFYYTAVPTKYNFTLRAKVTVNSWTYSNGQEGFGLMVTDRLGANGNTSNFWNNQIMALATKIEYRYDAESGMTYDLDGSGTKYSMKLGLGTIAKTGVTLKNLPLLEANDTDTINNQFLSEMYTLESAAGYWEMESGTYNVIGNCTNATEKNVEKGMLTEMILEIQKNNTGYFVTYYDANGNILAQKKYYGADSLNQLDPEYVYAGFFAARNARVTFSDVTFTTILASEDAPAEEKPKEQIKPTVTISSPSVTTSKDYQLVLDANVSGTVKISIGNTVIAEGEKIAAEVRYYKDITLPEYGENTIEVEFTPDPDQDLGPDAVLASKDKKYTSIKVMVNKGHYHRKTVYVSPLGLPNGTGSKEYPFDIQTAVNNATPGQTIVLMEGTYKLQAVLRIQRGMDGTAENPIRMIADPDAKTRPVLDFQKLTAGIVHGGDYWYFYGFDVTNSADGQKGFQVSGNYNTLDQIHAYRNGNTGIQLSRYSGKDLYPDWPAYNLVLNCTSYANADPGHQDADGFAAKLTVGDGNVFDGCVAYNNADDGWDMYAKVETGPIGAVIVRNCVAYSNGILEDGTASKGNGNGFKMGGESISGKHVLENSYAFFNRVKGIDSNSCPDITVINCISYNNGSHNVALYTNNAANTDFSASGVISFKDSTNTFEGGLSKEDNLKPKGTQDSAKYQGSSNYYWNGEVSINSAGKKVTADMFASLQFKGVSRKADGTIDLQGFLKLTQAAPEGSGATDKGQASQDNSTLPEDLVHDYSEEWVILDPDIHWHECECGDKSDIGAHEFQWIIDKEVTETENGKKHQECTVCGYKQPAITVYPTVEPDPTEPEAEPTQPSGGEEPAGVPNTVVIVIAVVILAGGAFAIWQFVIKKKKA